jgi:general secretion pathway protein F
LYCAIYSAIGTREASVVMNAQAGGNGVESPRPLSATLAEFIALNEEIAALVHARVPLEQQLARLGRELPGATGLLAKRLSDRLSAGESLDAAVAAEGRALPAAYRATIVAGLQSGHLGCALEALVDSAGRMDDLRRVTGMALLYPLLILAVACLLFAIMMTLLVPRFDWFYGRHFGFLAELAHWPTVVWALAFGVPTFVFLLALAWWWRSGRAYASSTAGMGFLSWLPWVGRVHHWSQAATFAELLHLLIQQDLPLDRALVLAADATDDRRLGAAAHQLANRVQQGQATRELLSTGMDAQFHGIPPMVRLALCQSTNRVLLTNSLHQAAETYRDRAIVTADWFTEYLPVLLTVTIGGMLTLGFTLLVFWPYSSMLRELSQWNWQ